MFGRQTRSVLPSIKTSPIPQDIAKKKQNRRNIVKSSFDRKAKDLPPFQIGDPVLFQYPEQKE